jgi:hypothetical protein
VLIRPALVTLTSLAAVATATLISGPAADASIARPASHVTATDRNWVGYAALGTRFRYVQAEFRVPKADCAKTPGSEAEPAQASAWVGLDGIFDKSVEQDGVAATCTDGVASYNAWLEAWPQANQIEFYPRAGDVIRASVYYSDGDYRLVLNDLTSGQGFDRVAACGAAECANKTAEVVTEDPEVYGSPGRYWPMVDYGTSDFWDIKITSQAGLKGNFDTAAWQNSQITMVDPSRHVMAVPASLAGNGTSFQTYWKREY